MTAALASLMFVAALILGLTLRGARLRRRDRNREIAAYRRTITELGGRLWFRTWQRDMEAAGRRRAQADAAGWKAVACAQFERLIDEKERAQLRPTLTVVPDPEQVAS